MHCDLLVCVPSQPITPQAILAALAKI